MSQPTPSSTAPGTDPDPVQLSRVVRYGYSGTLALLDPDTDDHVRQLASMAWWHNRALVERRVLDPDLADSPAAGDRAHQPRRPPTAPAPPPPDPPRRRLLGGRQRGHQAEAVEPSAFQSRWPNA